MTVSVIIPIYNAEKYLDECLSSVAGQTYSNFECVMIDDGSKDSSAEIAKSYAARDRRFKYFYQDNAGVSAARNHGLREARGDYITFLDSDDSLEKNYFKEYINCICRHNSAIVVGGYIQDNNKCLNYVIQSSGLSNYIENILAGNGGVVWSKFFSRDLLKNHHFRTDISMREDLLFQLELCKDLPDDISVSYLNYYGYLYRTTLGGLSSATRRLDSSAPCNTELVDLMVELGVSDDLISNFIKNIILWDCVACAKNKISVAEVINSPLIDKHCDRITINTIRDRILFSAIKKKNDAVANFVYRLYAARLGGK